MNQKMNIINKGFESKSEKLINVPEEQQVQIFAKQMLAKRLFIGHYQERRYVDALNSYRDIVVVTDSEDDLPRDLYIVKKRTQHIYPPHIVWTGITGPHMIGAPAGCCLWVKLNNLPFGYYWFQIREVIFDDSSEIFIRLKCLRSISHRDELSSMASADLKNQSANSDLPQDESSSNQDELKPTFDVGKVLSSMKGINYNELISGWIYSLSILFTPKNMHRVLSFLVVLILAAGTGFFKFVAYVGEYSLKLMREVSIFIQVCTPILLGIIDFFSKCFGGILILISVLWRGTPPNISFQQNFKPQRPPLALPATQDWSQPPRTYRPPRNYARPYN